MERQVLKVIHENHEVRLHCRHVSRNSGFETSEQYECRLGRVDDRWDLRIQRRPPDGHRLKFGQQLNPSLLPERSRFNHVHSPQAVEGLKAWAERFDYELEDDLSGGLTLLPREVTVSLRLPRKLFEQLEQRSSVEPGWSLNAEIVATLRGQRRPL